jgi:type II pantothenate kinase
MPDAPAACTDNASLPGCRCASQEGAEPFRETRENLVPRPWAVDDLDALVDRLCTHSYAKAVLFVDNAGADVVLGMRPLRRPPACWPRYPRLAGSRPEPAAGLPACAGMLPLARELLRRGTTVILAANESPSINDITFGELDAMLASVSHSDAVLCRGISTRRLQVVSSGNALPVIDLSQASGRVEVAGTAGVAAATAAACG